MPSPAFRLSALAALAAALVSCKTAQNEAAADPYASNYGSDGGYNPYPGSTGYVASTSPQQPAYQQPSYQEPTYQQPPVQEADPYSFDAPKTSPSSSGSSSTKKTASSSTAKKKTSTAKSKSYTVKKGDTLYGIAKKNGSTVAKIKSANGLSGDLIRPGQSLKVP